MTKNHKERVEIEKLMKRWRKIDSKIDSRRGTKRTPRWRAIRKWYDINDPVLNNPEYYL